MSETIEEVAVWCPRCEETWTIQLYYSDLLGCCYRCQNCDEEFPLDDLRNLFKKLDEEPIR